MAVLMAMRTLAVLSVGREGLFFPPDNPRVIEVETLCHSEGMK